MDNQYLLVCDFDGTLADTFSPGPNNKNVNTAYEYAIQCLFGADGIKIYKQIGGLKNKAPIELAKEILNNGSEPILMSMAYKYYLKERNQIEKIIPNKKGVPLNWNPAADPNQILTVIAEILVRCKLQFLLDEIGAQFSNGSLWPQPCGGVLQFLDAVARLNTEGINLQLAIISSGHEEFIKKTFAVWHVPCPQILLTDDDLRGLEYPKELEQKIKPSPFLFDLIHTQWLNTNPTANTTEIAMEKTRSKMAYFGDDPKKDGLLAKNANVIFGWFNPKAATAKELQSGSYFSFSNWERIGNYLKQKNAIEMMKNNFPLDKIFAPLIK